MTHYTGATSLGRIYDHALLMARATARTKGYALAVHGSELRDLDLVAVPWTDEACTQRELANAVIEAVKGTTLRSDPVKKPHGRLAWSIHLNHPLKLHQKTISKGFVPYLDLSVMPPRRQRTGPAAT